MGDLDERLRQVQKENGYSTENQKHPGFSNVTMESTTAGRISNGREGSYEKVFNNGPQQQIKENDNAADKKTSAYSGELANRFSSNDAYFTDSESDDEDFENEFEFR